VTAGRRLEASRRPIEGQPLTPTVHGSIARSGMRPRGGRTAGAFLHQTIVVSSVVASRAMLRVDYRAAAHAETVVSPVRLQPHVVILWIVKNR
jgi:hypothetical protein